MRPLSPGALEPARRQGRGSTAVVVVSCLAGLLVLVAPVIFFFSIFGDPYGRGFVEQREDGLYAQLRACERDTIHSVLVAPYDGQTERPAPIWSATSSSSVGASALKLFSTQPDFKVSRTDVAVPPTFEVIINQGRQSETSVVVERGELDQGQVAFGGGPVSRVDYEAMNNADFGCPQ